jgi:hypothetical protein
VAVVWDTLSVALAVQVVVVMVVLVALEAMELMEPQILVVVQVEHQVQVAEQKPVAVQEL